jgi:hypothetical protein
LLRKSALRLPGQLSANAVTNRFDKKTPVQALAFFSVQATDD